MASLSGDIEAENIQACNSSSRYLDGVLNIASPYSFGLQDIVNFAFWVVTFPVLPLTGFTFLNLFSLLECQVMRLTVRNKIITAKLLRQGHRYHKLR